MQARNIRFSLDGVRHIINKREGLFHEQAQEDPFSLLIAFLTLQQYLQYDLEHKSL